MRCPETQPGGRGAVPRRLWCRVTGRQFGAIHAYGPPSWALIRHEPGRRGKPLRLDLAARERGDDLTGQPNRSFVGGFRPGCVRTRGALPAHRRATGVCMTRVVLLVLSRCGTPGAHRDVVWFVKTCHPQPGNLTVSTPPRSTQK